MCACARKRSTDGMREPLARPVLGPMPSDGVVVDEVDHYRSRASWSGIIQSNAINPGPGKIEEVAVSNGVGDSIGSKGFSGNSKPGCETFAITVASVTRSPVTELNIATIR